MNQPALCGRYRPLPRSQPVKGRRTFQLFFDNELFFVEDVTCKAATNHFVYALIHGCDRTWISNELNEQANSQYIHTHRIGVNPQSNQK